jgi:hypothetical protein
LSWQAERGKDREESKKERKKEHKKAKEKAKKKMAALPFSQHFKNLAILSPLILFVLELLLVFLKPITPIHCGFYGTLVDW